MGHYLPQIGLGKNKTFASSFQHLDDSKIKSHKDTMRSRTHLTSFCISAQPGPLHVPAHMLRHPVSVPRGCPHPCAAVCRSPRPRASLPACRSPRLAPRARPAPDGCTAATQTRSPDGRGVEERSVAVSRCRSVEVSKCQGVEVSRSVVSSDAVRGRGGGGLEGTAAGEEINERWAVLAESRSNAIYLFMPISINSSQILIISLIIPPASAMLTVSKIAVMASKSSVNNGGTALTETVLAYGLLYE